MRKIKKSRPRGPQEKVKPFPGVSGSPQTIGSRDATGDLLMRIEEINPFQSPNYRVTRCNYTENSPVEVFHFMFQSPNYRVTRCNRKNTRERRKTPMVRKTETVQRKANREALRLLRRSRLLPFRPPPEVRLVSCEVRWNGRRQNKP